MEILKGKTIKEINLGDKASYSRTVTEADVLLFGSVSGDLNPAHFDEEYSKNTIFKGRISHGMLSSSYISAVLGMQLPGPGTIYLSQELKFISPVRFGDTITAMVEVIEKVEGKNRIVLDTTCINQHGNIVVNGKAVVMPPK